MQENRNSPLLHIGYHKTASSWLQHSVFPHAPGVRYVAGPHDAERTLNRLFFAPNSFHYDADEARGVFGEKIGNTDDGRLAVISHERFSGSPFTGGHDSRTQAERLREVFPDALVLVVIREQADMLLSMYKQYVQAGGGASFPQFLKPGESGTMRNVFRLDYLEYDRLISHYTALFGQNRVLVLPFELLKAGQQRFLDALSEFTGADFGQPDPERRKVSRSAAALALERYGNRLLSLSALNPAPLFGIRDGNKRVKKFTKRLDRRLPERIRQRADLDWREYAAHRTSGRYAESNARSSRMLGTDLGSYGYQMPGRNPADDPG